jgi:chromosome segregation ATPase
METPIKSGQPCPGPAKSRSRIETLRGRREQLKEEIRRASARLAEAEVKAERMRRIESRRRDLAEREQLSECSKQAGLDRYRLPSDGNFPDAHPAMDIHLISAAIAWLSQKMSAMSEADLAAMREEGALRAEEVQKKRDAHEKRDAPEPAKARGEIERPLAFDLPE